MAELSKQDRIKKLLREEECQFFADGDVEFYLSENDVLWLRKKLHQKNLKHLRVLLL